MLRQQGCLVVHVTSSFLILGLKGGFTERPCRIRTLDLHRIYSRFRHGLRVPGNCFDERRGVESAKLENSERFTHHETHAIDETDPVQIRLGRAPHDCFGEHVFSSFAEQHHSSGGFATEREGCCFGRPPVGGSSSAGSSPEQQYGGDCLHQQQRRLFISRLVRFVCRCAFHQH